MMENSGIIDGLEYARREGGILLEKCPACSGSVIIPEQIEGEPVRWAAPYAFSRTNVTSVALPRYMEQIGNYVFYRCFHLKSLSFSDALNDVGAGAFTGSAIRNIEIRLYKGEKSVLKFIADEIRYALTVTMRYCREDGSEERAKLIFPEHYEEAVENTPARIVETHYHGSGGDYRQCFYDRELNYSEYDRLFPRAVAEETEETASEMAALRLRYPYKLSQAAKAEYAEYVKEHLMAAASIYIDREESDMLRFFGKEGFWSRDTLEGAIEEAAEKEKTEILSVLMEQRHRYFPKQKKVFEL